MTRKETAMDSLIQFGWFNPCVTTRTKDNTTVAHFADHEQSGMVKPDRPRFTKLRSVDSLSPGFKALHGGHPNEYLPAQPSNAFR
jgi:hypothetical protein